MLLRTGRIATSISVLSTKSRRKAHSTTPAMNWPRDLPEFVGWLMRQTQSLRICGFAHQSEDSKRNCPRSDGRSTTGRSIRRVPPVSCQKRQEHRRSRNSAPITKDPDRMGGHPPHSRWMDPQAPSAEAALVTFRPDNDGRAKPPRDTCQRACVSCSCRRKKSSKNSRNGETGR
jgi:hypothetical protein